MRRRRTWENFNSRHAGRPTWLNYPLLPGPEPGYEPTEKYMLETLEQAINQFTGVPDIACVMMVKVAKMIILCIQDFHTSIAYKTFTRLLQ